MSRSDLYHPIVLPGLTLPGNLFLAPLAGFTDAAFRSICIDHGADFTFTEMVSAEGLIRDNKKTTDLMLPAANETRYGIQLFASTPESAALGVRKCLPFRPALIDLNCGCPVPKVVKTGAGSALLKDPVKLGAVIRAMVGASGSIPVTVKIRLGWDPDSINYLETAGAAVEAGAAMVCLHARTRAQGYSGTADWSHIALLKETIPVPVIGSGDLYTPENAERLLEETGCDGLIFARGAIGNPFIFSRTKKYLRDKETPAAVSAEEKVKTAMDHFNRFIAQIGEPRACREMKKHFAAYTKGSPAAGALRNEIMSCRKPSDFERVFEEYLSNLP